jgi:lipocalin
MRTRNKIFLAGAAITLATVALVKAKDKPSVEPLKVVPSIDVNKYMGTWYEVARLPNRFESDCEKDVSATYSLRADGNINVLNQCRKKSGEMKKAEGIAKSKICSRLAIVSPVCLGRLLGHGTIFRL